MPPVKRLAVAVTGASGAPYAVHFLRALLELEINVNLIVSPAGERVVAEELAPGVFEDILSNTLIRRLPHKDTGAVIASGSSAADAMVVIPASMGTVGRIRSGLSTNLIERAADVMLKEGKPLIIVPREAPLNIIHLENLLGLARAGAVIFPACPGFYHKPQSLGDLYAFMTGRLLDRLGITNAVAPRWQDDTAENSYVSQPKGEK